MSDIQGELITFESQTQNEIPTWTLSIPMNSDNEHYLKCVQKAEELASFVWELKNTIRNIDKYNDLDTFDIDILIKWIYDEINERGLNFS